MPAVWKKWCSVLLVSATMAGCTSPEYVTEHPVSNPVPPPKAGVYRIEKVDVPPVATHEIEPDDPPELGSILSGKAVVVFTVRVDGKVADASVVQADDVLFGEAAVDAISKWRFSPAQLKGTPVACQMTLPFIFTSPYGYYPGGDFGSDPSSGAPPDGGSNKTSVIAR